MSNQSIKQSDSSADLSGKEEKLSLRSILPVEMHEEFKDVILLQEQFQKKMEETWKKLGTTAQAVQKSMDDPAIPIEKRRQMNEVEISYEKKLRSQIKESLSKKPNQKDSKSRKKTMSGERRKWIPVR